MGYSLKDHDLTRHVATAAGVRRYHLRIGTPLGKGGGSHLPGSPVIESIAYDVGGVKLQDHIKRLDDLMARVQTNEDSETVDENAWNEVTVRLEAMSKIAQAKQHEMAVERKRSAKAAEGAVVGATIAGTAALMLKSHAPKRAVAFGKEWANEGVAHSLAVYGANFSASAVSLIGAQQSEHFAKAFESLIANPAVEIGFTSAAALLISALLTRIRKALRNRRDRKIAKARGEVLSGNPTLKGSVG